MCVFGIYFFGKRVYSFRYIVKVEDLNFKIGENIEYMIILKKFKFVGLEDILEC